MELFTGYSTDFNVIIDSLQELQKMYALVSELFAQVYTFPVEIQFQAVHILEEKITTWRETQVRDNGSPSINADSDTIRTFLVGRIQSVSRKTNDNAEELSKRSDVIPETYDTHKENKIQNLGLNSSLNPDEELVTKPEIEELGNENTNFNKNSKELSTAVPSKSYKRKNKTGRKSNESIVVTTDQEPNLGENSKSMMVDCKVEDIVMKRRRGRPRKIGNIEGKSPSPGSKNHIAHPGIKTERNDTENVNSDSNAKQSKKGPGNLQKSTPRKKPGRPRKISLETEVKDTSRNNIKTDLEATESSVPEVSESGTVLAKRRRGRPPKQPKVRNTRGNYRKRTSRSSPGDLSDNNQDECEDEPESDDDVYIPESDLSANAEEPESCKKTCQCHICHKVLCNPSTLRVHLRVHTGEKPYACSTCGKRFSQISGLHLHEKYHQGKREYKCTYCEYHGYQKVDVVRHEWRQHLNYRPYICDVCGKGFVAVDSLNRHKTSHERDKKFLCDKCEFITHSLDILRIHTRNIHTPREMFTCELCGTKLRYKNTYAMHMRRHKGEKPCKCNICDKGFTTRSQLAAHRKTHVPREHNCEVCGKEFMHKSHLRRHAVIHSGEKLHPCPACSYKCNVRSNLKKHCRAVHKLEYPPAPEIGRKVLKVISSDQMEAADGNLGVDLEVRIAEPETTLPSSVRNELDQTADVSQGSFHQTGSGDGYHEYTVINKPDPADSSVGFDDHVAYLQSSASLIIEAGHIQSSIGFDNQSAHLHISDRHEARLKSPVALDDQTVLMKVSGIAQTEQVQQPVRFAHQVPLPDSSNVLDNGQGSPTNTDGDHLQRSDHLDNRPGHLGHPILLDNPNESQVKISASTNVVAQLHSPTGLYSQDSYLQSAAVLDQEVGQQPRPYHGPDSSLIEHNDESSRQTGSMAQQTNDLPQQYRQSVEPNNLTPIQTGGTIVVELPHYPTDRPAEEKVYTELVSTSSQPDSPM